MNTSYPLLQPVALTGIRLRLEPLGEQHIEDLWEAVDIDLFKYMPLSWRGNTFEEFAEVTRGIISDQKLLPFAMVLNSNNKAVGSSTYLDIRLEHRSLEIGMTWISKEFQQSFVNPEAKLLMMGHAFEDLECVRIQLKTDARNLQSQRAMEKLGCTREGVLRNHMVLPDGFIRDSTMYSVLDSEWPFVKQKLENRLRTHT